MEIKKAFGEKLRELRDKRGLSREKLAELAELEYTFIYLLETGRRQPTLTTLFLLARALSVSASGLVASVEAVTPHFSGRGERKSTTKAKPRRKKSASANSPKAKTLLNKKPARPRP